MKKILIIRLTSLGDVIFTLPLVNALADCEQRAKRRAGMRDVADPFNASKQEGNQIGYVVAEKGLEVIKNNPMIDKLHFVPLKEWKKRPFALKTFKEFFEIIKEIRKEKYDIAFDCQQMFKSLFLFMFCGAKRRITFKDARELSILGGNEFVTPKAKFGDFNYHIVERNLDFARHIGVDVKEIKFPLPQTSQEAKDKIEDLLKETYKTIPTVVISPATTWENKHWAEKNWAKLIDGIQGRCNLVFTGTNTDWALIARILDKSENKDLKYVNLVGKTNVEELRELFLRSKVVISPDSGSAHLAWASGVPAVVAIFTCTPAKRFGPYGDGEKYFSIASNQPCQPCFKKKCLLKKDKNICLKYPEAAEIINIVNNLL